MKDFNYYLNSKNEVGFVDQVVHSLVYIVGLPEAHPNELVIFESGDLGLVRSLLKDNVEVVLLTSKGVRVGSQVARTGGYVHIGVGDELVGRMIDPLGTPLDDIKPANIVKNVPIDRDPPGMIERKVVDMPLETGVSVIDLIVPLSKGQRQLILGDRKTGKTEVILKTIVTQASQGSICVYASIGQKQTEVRKLYNFFKTKGVIKNVILVIATSSSPTGLILLTPYAAMTIAEYFKDQGKDVVVVLDDMTSHARYYREISLLGKRFPGRSSYPGDIFYIHSRIIERAGKFKEGSITCLPVSETILGDLSGYIQTNLMAMTDGHLFFDIDLFNQGRRPSVSPFLSVTRVGHQTQTPLARDVSRQLTSFLVSYEKMKQFLHFGAEVGDRARNILALGARLDVFFNQDSQITVPLNLNLLILAGFWAGFFNEISPEDLRPKLDLLTKYYVSDSQFKQDSDNLVKSAKSFSDLVNLVRRKPEILTK